MSLFRKLTKNGRNTGDFLQKVYFALNFANFGCFFINS